MPLTKKQMREYQRARRATKLTHSVNIELTGKQYKFFRFAMLHSKDALHKFKTYSLLTGAVFRANCGQANGKKIKMKKGLIV